MSKFNLMAIVKDVRVSMVKHSPEILTGLGITGMITTAVLAARATPKALRLIEMKAEEENCHVEELKPVEKAKACWKCYIPAAALCATSVACLIGASSVNARRNAALAAAYTLSDTAFREYKEKVVETIGEKKEQIVRDKVAEDQVKRDPVQTKEVIIVEKGGSLCFDPISGRYFNSDINKIKRAINELNARILTSFCGYVSLNDFYDEIGLSHIDIGDDLGWNLDNRIELRVSYVPTEDGEPCAVIGHEVVPKYDYY